MTPERWQEIQTQFHRLLDQGEDARRRALDELTERDPDLGREVASMLAADAVAEAGSDAAADAVSDALDAALPTAEPPPTGQRLGPYRLLKEIGRGGMGTVFLARRDDGEFHKHVAIKVVRPGPADAEILRRMRQERHILAGLEHPAIARLLDGGATGDGRPYVVMEHVEGEPIDDFCRHRDLPIPERLQLFRRVCDAVHYAHQKLVLHRDIKPGNLLVTAEGDPKLLDFGIAKMLDSEVPFTRAETRTGMRLLTPEFASPEQIQGDSLTTASDVYSLGVLLHVLLTDRPPAPQGSPRTRPSSAVDDERRRRQLAGDLDTIVLAALREEPERRYASARQLGDDLRRHLESLPVKARPDTLGYRFGKFLRRHRLLAAAAVLVLVSLVAGLTTTTWQARRAKAEQVRAERQTLRAERHLDLLLETLAQADPGNAVGRDVTVREMLDDFVTSLALEPSEPQDRAEILETSGRVYLSLGRLKDAEAALTRALDLRPSGSMDTVAERIESLGHLAELRFAQGEFAAAESLLREMQAAGRDRYDPSHPRWIEILNDLAVVADAQGRGDEAAERFAEALDGLESSPTADPLDLARTLANVGVFEIRRGDAESAERYLQRALELRTRLLDPRHPDLSTNVVNLGAALTALERWDEAEELLRDALDRIRGILDEDHPRVADSRQNLAALLSLRGRFDEAEPLYRAALASHHRRLGEGHPDVALVSSNLADLLERGGELDEAEALRRRALAIHRSGGAPADLAVTLVRLANLLHRQDRYAEALPLYREALTMPPRPSQGVEPSLLWLRIGRGLLRTGRPADAEEPLRRALELLGDDGDPRRRADVEATLGLCLLESGREEEGRRWIREALPLLVEVFGGEDPRVQAAQAALDRSG
ncbi:MAG: serine/threonine-protein kinase [Acidobacteriota bacterium]